MGRKLVDRNGVVAVSATRIRFKLVALRFQFVRERGEFLGILLDHANDGTTAHCGRPFGSSVDNRRGIVGLLLWFVCS
jgi:hypothetical protein